MLLDELTRYYTIALFLFVLLELGIQLELISADLS